MTPNRTTPPPRQVALWGIYLSYGIVNLYFKMCNKYRIIYISKIFGTARYQKIQFQILLHIELPTRLPYRICLDRERFAIHSLFVPDTLIRPYSLYY